MVKDRATYQTGMRAASPRPVPCVTASRSVLKEHAPGEEKTMKARVIKKTRPGRCSEQELIPQRSLMIHQTQEVFSHGDSRHP